MGGGRAWLSATMLAGFLVVAGLQLALVVVPVLLVLALLPGSVALQLGVPLCIATVGVMAYATWRALRTRRGVPAGVPVTRTDAPELWSLIDAAAGAAAVRAPDSVIVVAEPTATLSEHTRLLGLIGGRRDLYLGLPLLQAWDNAQPARGRRARDGALLAPAEPAGRRWPTAGGSRSAVPSRGSHPATRPPCCCAPTPRSTAGSTPRSAARRSSPPTGSPPSSPAPPPRRPCCATVPPWRACTASSTPSTSAPAGAPATSPTTSSADSCACWPPAPTRWRWPGPANRPAAPLGHPPRSRRAAGGAGRGRRHRGHPAGAASWCPTCPASAARCRPSPSRRRAAPR